MNDAYKQELERRRAAVEMTKRHSLEEIDTLLRMAPPRSMAKEALITARLLLSSVEFDRSNYPAWNAQRIEWLEQREHDDGQV